MATLYEMAPEVKFLCDMLESEQIDNQVFEDSLKGLEVDKKIEMMRLCTKAARKRLRSL